MKHYQDSYRAESERTRSNADKRDSRNAERLERAKRRVEQIRSIIGSINDPANLNSSTENNETADTSTSTNPTNDASNSYHPSPDTIRLLSNAIAGCLQPCTVINKVLNEVCAMIPQIMEQQTYSGAAGVSTPSSTPAGLQPPQSFEIPKQTTATNTSDANTPVPNRQANHEIEALFKEAAKELEKMNEIVNSSKMESSVASTSSSGMTGLTQIERVFANINDSAISNATMVNMGAWSNNNEDQDATDAGANTSSSAIDEESFKIVTPPKSMRSRESSIEVHDAHSVMSDDSRDWTMLSAEQDEFSVDINQPAQQQQRVVAPNTGAVPKGVSAQVDIEIQTEEVKNDSIKSVTAETQTPSSLLGNITQQQLQDSVQKSIDIVQKSIVTIQKTIENTTPQHSDESASAAVVQSVEPVPPSLSLSAPKYVVTIPSPVGSTPKQAPPPPLTSGPSYFRKIEPIAQPVRKIEPTAPTVPVAVERNQPALSQANMKATDLYPKINQQKFPPAVVVYDPNPKINAAVHTMMNMGFSNEGMIH